MCIRDRTRAGIIEKLVRIGFLERKGDKKTKHLIPTHKGIALVTVMPEQIQSPSMTADWEEKLLLIERKEYSSEDFMQEIRDVIFHLVRHYLSLIHIWKLRNIWGIRMYGVAVLQAPVLIVPVL